MKDVTITKATDAQRSAYDGLYPLYGYATIGGITCAIEKPTKLSRDDPAFEVIAPEGYCFDPDLHALLCFSLTDMKNRLRHERLEIDEI